MKTELERLAKKYAKLSHQYPKKQLFYRTKLMEICKKIEAVQKWVYKKPVRHRDTLGGERRAA